MRTDLEERLRFCRNLPTLPGVALRMIELGNDPQAGMGEIAKTIALDPALAIKLLKAANSPLYGRRRKAENLRQALSLLGLNTAITLALSFSLGISSPGPRQTGLDTVLYWRRSLIAALACRILGQQRGMTSLEELFLAGLLQDIGILVLDSMMPAKYGPLVTTITDHDRLARAEQTALGSNHAEVGAWLLRHWNLPEYLQLAVAGSNDPAAVQAPRDLIFIVPCVALSGRIADVWLYPDDEHISIRAVNAASQWLGIEEEEYRTVLEAMAEALPEVSALFEIKLIDPLQIAGILDQAKELLALRNLREAAEAQRKTQTLESRIGILEEQQHLDALTGLFNRSRLDEVLNTEFNNASKRGWPLSVAFIDLDHFKEVNDTYGHQAGDWVLVSVARLLAASMRKTDVVARYGGEEFVLILPGTGGEAAQTVLERALASIRDQAHPIDEGQSIQVTASIGLATHMESGHQFESPEDLLRAADRALYTAKRTGRNQLITYNQPDGGNLYGIISFNG